MRISILTLIVPILFGCANTNKEVYLFSYFLDNGEDGLHLAFSEDGLIWTAINDNESLLQPVVGQDKLMRDPCIIKGGDGRFHMVWTVSWNERGIGYACSEDLIHWSEQKYIPVMHHEPAARNCWAPELFYDKEADQYLIYWASTIPGRFPETDSSGDNGYNHRMYYCTTKNFVDFSDTKLFYDQGFNVIDATIHEIDGMYAMFLKDETRYPEPEKNIRMARSTQLYGNYSPATEPIAEDWVEGPTAIRNELGWIVYFDRYIKHEMGAVLSEDLINWADISHRVKFPEGTRHGTVFKVSKRIFNNLMKQTTDSS
jgi:hypothetical protein